MSEAILITGGNLGDVRAILESCNVLINQHVGHIKRYSQLYESEPWGFEADTNFFNQVLVVDTMLNPGQLLVELQEIEKRLGRVKNKNISSEPNKKREYVSRAIDIDILFYDNQIVSLPELSIPHALLHERDFVLKPLCELVPDKLHPIFNKSCSELLMMLKNKKEK